MLRMISFLFCLVGIVLSTNLQCDQGWTAHDGYCYKHFDTPKARVIMDDMRKKCRNLGGDIATGGTAREREIMETLNRASYVGKESEYDLPNESLLTGFKGNANDTWFPVHSTYQLPLPFCGFNYMLYPLPRYCLLHRTFKSRPFCYQYVSCHGSGAWGFRRYICKRSKQLPAPVTPKPTVKPTVKPATQPPAVICTNKDTVAQGGKCVCKEGYVDIRQTDAVDRNNYKEGEKCVPKEPCKSLTRTLSIIYIIDASQSIQARNWPSLVDFLRSGALLLPNTVNVGFIKFASEVTFAQWLPTKWSTKQFQQTVPTDFDAGYTNTPAALDKAIEMFDQDGSQEKVAVLITDGLPVIDAETDKQKGLSDTADAAARLRLKRINLVALGFGPELAKLGGYSYMQKWLEDPTEDYFSFDKEACDLKSVHMQILLQKVCRRFV